MSQALENYLSGLNGESIKEEMTSQKIRKYEDLLDDLLGEMEPDSSQDADIEKCVRKLEEIGKELSKLKRKYH